MKIKKTFLGTAIILGSSIFCACNTVEQQSSNDSNLYWPGNFEQAVYGGNFSRALNVVLDDTDNFTQNGNKAWHLMPGKYQHLEILTTDKGEWTVSFMAKSIKPVDVLIKPVFQDEEHKKHTEDHAVSLVGDGQWHPYRVTFKVSQPYPGPKSGELLVSCYNGSGADAWIDNLELSPAPSNKLEASFTKPNPSMVTNLIKNNDFESGISHWQSTTEGAVFDASSLRKLDIEGNKTRAIVLSPQVTEGATASVGQAIDATSLAGKRIRVSAEVSFLTLNGNGFSWHGFLLDVHEGDNKDGKVISGDPSPNWMPMGLSAPVGKSKRCYSEYFVPAGTEHLFIELKTLPKMADNLVAVDNVTIEVI